jgi:hypothetical protein
VMRWAGEKVIVSRLDKLTWAESFNPYPHIRAPTCMLVWHKQEYTEGQVSLFLFNSFSIFYTNYMTISNHARTLQRLKKIDCLIVVYPVTAPPLQLRPHPLSSVRAAQSHRRPRTFPTSSSSQSRRPNSVAVVRVKPPRRQPDHIVFHERARAKPLPHPYCTIIPISLISSMPT